MNRAWLSSIVFALAACSSPTQFNHATAIDGDTFKQDGIHYRLTAVDAPELPGHCRPGRHCAPGDPFASRTFLQSILNDGVTCYNRGTDYYRRQLVDCYTLSGADVSTLLINSGNAIRWPHD